MKQYDVIIVGSGIAGLSFALKVAQAGHEVLVITKKDRAESNTNYAQGGIAAVTSATDDLELHVQDTLIAGDGLCEESAVKQILADGPACIDELVQLGVDFSHLDDGRISLGREGGHSKRRILHVKDVTGKAIEAALLHAAAETNRVTIQEHYFAIDLITRARMARRGIANDNGRDSVIGLYALNVNSGEVEAFQARAIMLATGGCGQVYQFTTNPGIATGDGIAMAWRAGVEVRNLEFIQFHPTALYTTTNERFLISEAVRGEGAILRNMQGEAFMSRYDERAELAPRDIVARAIDREMKRSGAQHMWLDITHEPEAELRERFPGIFDGCMRHGINMGKDFIPVVPAAHYMCGGVRTAMDASTSLAGLYACGEVACTGLHGANRLASNSLLEAIVMAHRGAQSVSEYLSTYPAPDIELPSWFSANVQDADERVVLAHNWEELKRTMWDYVGIVRTTRRLERARSRVKTLAQEIRDYYWNFKVEPELLELRNLVQVADLIIECAQRRLESRGLHYSLDFPDKLDDLQNTVLRRPVISR